jgi:glutaredoxin
VDYSSRGCDVEYVNVLADGEALNKMLEHSKGKREVPVIVEGDKVTIGFGGS